MFVRAAHTLARTTGYLAHEILHTVWAVETGRFVPASTPRWTSWGEVGAPPLFMPQAIQAYAFHPWAKTDPSGLPILETEAPLALTNAPALGPDRPSRHWVVYVYQRMIEALLRNDEFFWPFYEQHQDWCTRAGTTAYINAYCNQPIPLPWPSP